jgi:hypothetical protein
MPHTVWGWVAFGLVLVFGVARAGRLATFDDYPPAEWLRIRWIALVGERWGKLAQCYWCANPYIVAVALLWAWLSNLHWTWWVFWGWLAASQIASTISAYDQPSDGSD